ncbi:MAG: hypothetical protein K0S37_3837 [Microbacterium sp.]|nr:hypothetical protein [Microbacterium sp.]
MPYAPSSGTAVPLGALHPFPGGEVAIGGVGDSIYLRINGVIVETVTHSTITEAGLEGLARGGSSAFRAKRYYIKPASLT